MIYTKPKRNFTEISGDGTPRFVKKARLIGRELHEGIFIGVSDDPQLLHGEYDDETSSSVDPFCRLGGDRFGREFVSPPSTQTVQDTETSDTSDVGSNLRNTETPSTSDGGSNS